MDGKHLQRSAAPSLLVESKPAGVGSTRKTCRLRKAQLAGPEAGCAIRRRQRADI